MSRPKSGEIVPVLPENSFGNSCTDTNDWEKMLNFLVEFKDEHGHCNVPYNYTKNPSLGAWVLDQRCKYREFLEGNTASLSFERVKLLLCLGFSWSSEDPDELCEYQDQEDFNLNSPTRRGPLQKVHNSGISEECQIPPRLMASAYQEEDLFNLYSDVMHELGELQLMKEEILQSMSQDMIDSYQLGSNGNAENVNPVQDQNTEKLTSNLFAKKMNLQDGINMHARNPTATSTLSPHVYSDAGSSIFYPHMEDNVENMAYGADSPKNQWVRTSPISEQNEVELETLSHFPSPETPIELWWARFAELEAYHEKNGNCCVPYHYPPNPNLGIWVSIQVREYKLWKDGKVSSINDICAKNLERIGFGSFARKHVATVNSILRNGTKIKLLNSEKKKTETIKKQVTFFNGKQSKNSVVSRSSVDFVAYSRSKSGSSISNQPQKKRRTVLNEDYFPYEMKPRRLRTQLLSDSIDKDSVAKNYGCNVNMAMNHLKRQHVAGISHNFSDVKDENTYKDDNVSINITEV